MRHRWYAPKLGRFITRDPAGYVDGSSLYQYVQGNPLLYFDPFGLKTWLGDMYRAVSDAMWDAAEVAVNTDTVVGNVAGTVIGAASGAAEQLGSTIDAPFTDPDTGQFSAAVTENAGKALGHAVFDRAQANSGELSPGSFDLVRAAVETGTGIGNIADAAIGFDMESGQALTGSDRVSEGLLGLSALSGTAAGVTAMGTTTVSRLSSSTASVHYGRFAPDFGGGQRHVWATVDDMTVQGLGPKGKMQIHSGASRVEGAMLSKPLLSITEIPVSKSRMLATSGRPTANCATGAATAVVRGAIPLP